MCTVTVVPGADGFRLMCNRDERRDRPPALPARAHRVGGRTAVFPIDPDGGGTWIGVNDAGLALALLNRNRAPAFPRTPRRTCSRGVVIPALLRHGRLPTVVEAARRLDAERFEPFTLVAVQGREVGLVVNDGVQLCTERAVLSGPLLYTSSSLGDLVVDPPRRTLFEELMRACRDAWPERQAAFHDHRWPHHPELSVRMARPDARTVSRSRIDVGADRIVLEYESIPDPGCGGQP